METRHLNAEDARLSPRPGEVGVAREWVVWSRSNSDDFDARLSSVELAAPGPLTRLEEYDRTLIVTDGEGLIFDHGDAAPRVNVRRLESYSFPGEWPCHIELHRGVVTVLNVTTRRTRAEARIEALRLGTRRVMESLEGSAALLHVLRGTLRARVANEEEPFVIAGGEALWLEETDSEEIEIQGESTDCEALLVRLRQHS